MVSWKLENHQAQLESNELRGAIDLSCPAMGLSDVSASGIALPDATLLGPRIPHLDDVDAEAVAEGRARGAELNVTYRQSPAWPVQVDASWRVAREDHAIDLTVSVRTSVLDGRPELTVESILHAEEVLRLVDENSARFETLTVASDAGSGCLVFRCSDSDLSYVEMIHPDDFRRDELCEAPESPDAVRLRHHLFLDPLEKGVILRARLRGVFLPRQDDLRAAAACHASFATAEPPLGS